MNETNDPYLGDFFNEDLVSKFETMINKNEKYFFDVHEFEDIIDYYLDRDEFKTAWVAVDMACSQHPYSEGIQMKKAQVLIDKGEFIKALQTLSVLEKTSSELFDVYILKGTAYIHLGDLDKGMKTFNRAAKYSEEEIDEIYYNIAVTFIGASLLKEAIIYLEKGLEFNPESLPLIYELAYCHERLDNYQECIETYNRYLDIDPYAEMIWYRLGQVYEEVELFDKAIEAYQFSIAIEDEFSLAYMNLASVLMTVNRQEEAISTYKYFLELEEDSIEAYINIGIIYEDLGKIEKAIGYYNEAIKQDQSADEAYYRLGKIQMENSEVMSAIENFNKAIHFAPEISDYWFASAQANHLADFIPEAKYAFKKAKNLDPDNLEFWTEYAYFFYTIDEIGKAVQVIYDASVFFNDSPEIFYYLGYFLIKGGNLESGKQNLSKGIELDYLYASEMSEKFDDFYEIKEIKDLIFKFNN